jgi:hypothetical protein
MRFVRVAESAAEAQVTYEQMLAEQQNQQAQDALDATAAGAVPPSSVIAVGEGDPATGPPPATRFDLLAHDGLGSPFLWRLLAAYNEVPDPLRVDPGTVLAVPPPIPGGAGYVPGNAPPPPPPPPTLPPGPEEF